MLKRQAMLAAAEKRAAKGLLGVGGGKLGGDKSVVAGLTPAQAASRAAQVRVKGVRRWGSSSVWES